MSGEVNENQYVSYPIFKGLQKPLDFMGFQGRYISWAGILLDTSLLTRRLPSSLVMMAG